MPELWCCVFFRVLLHNLRGHTHSLYTCTHHLILYPLDIYLIHFVPLVLAAIEPKIRSLRLSFMHRVQCLRLQGEYIYIVYGAKEVLLFNTSDRLYFPFPTINHHRFKIHSDRLNDISKCSVDCIVSTINKTKQNKQFTERCNITYHILYKYIHLIGIENKIH